jgi:hypothetical protein
MIIKMVLIDTKTIFSYLRSSYNAIVSEIDSNNLVEKVVERLKGDLCTYLMKEVPEIEKKSDEWINGVLPKDSSEQVRLIVDDIVNQMIEEIVKEIESYMNSSH